MHTGTYQPFKNCGDTRKPDILIFNGSKAAVIETDEHHHKDYDSNCEWAKILQHVQSLKLTDGIDAAHAIRLNVHGGVKGQRITMQERAETTAKLIRQLFARDDDHATFNFVYYPTFEDIVHEVDEEEVDDWIDKLATTF